MGVRDQQDDDSAVEDGKISHHAHHGFLLGTLDVRGADQFRGTSKLCVCPSCGDDRYRFAAPHERASIRLQARSSLDGDGFSREHGLIEQDRALD